MTEQTTLTSDVRDYVAAVRTALGDLAPDELDDLTQGMEADLLDVARESSDPLRERLGDPEAYAAELRSAAGLAPRVAPSKTSVLADWDTRLKAAPSKALSRWPWLRDLQPVWWVARGLVIAWILSGVGATTNVVLVAFLTVPVSFWVGKVSSGWSRWPSFGVTALNTIAAVLLLPAVVWSTHLAATETADAYPVTYSQPGLTQDGNAVTNIYAFDDRGNRLDRVRLFNQDGQPLRLDPGSIPVSEHPDGSYPESVTGPVEVFPHSFGDFKGWATPPAVGCCEQLWAPPLTIPPLLPDPTASSSAPTATAPGATAPTSPPPTTLAPTKPTTPAASATSTTKAH